MRYSLLFCLLWPNQRWNRFCSHPPTLCMYVYFFIHEFICVYIVCLFAHHTLQERNVNNSIFYAFIFMYKNVYLMRFIWDVRFIVFVLSFVLLGSLYFFEHLHFITFYYHLHWSIVEQRCAGVEGNSVRMFNIYVCFAKNVSLLSPM